VRESAGRSVETVKVVAEASGASKVPVEDTVRGASATVDSLANAAGEATKTDASALPAPGSHTGEEAAVKRSEGPTPRHGRIGPPSTAPSPTDDLALSVPRGETRLATPGHASAITAAAGAVDIHPATDQSSFEPSGDAAGATPMGSQRAPSLPPPPVGTAALPSSGGGFGSSLLVLGLLALFVLVAPRTPPRLLSAGARYRPVPFVCALERPG
jgi:hypothetical protein